MLVLNVNNSQKMPLWHFLWHFNSPYWLMRIQNALLFVYLKLRWNGQRKRCAFYHPRLNLSRNKSGCCKLRSYWILTEKNYAGVALYMRVTLLAAKHVCLGPVKLATCTDSLAKSRTTLYSPQPATSWFVARQIWFVGGKTSTIAIECFQLTSRRPYWCSKTMKRRPCWCPKPILWTLNSLFGRDPNRVMETACFDANVQ